MTTTCHVTVSRFVSRLCLQRAHKPLLALGLAATAAALLAAAGLNLAPGPGPRPKHAAAMPEPEPAPRRAIQPIQAIAPEVQAEVFPASRVRLNRAPDHAPEPFYLNHRLVLRSLRVAAEGGGLRITGDLYTDFDCDSAPADAKLATGQVQGLQIDVELRDRTPWLVTDKSGAVLSPRLDPRDPGTLVPGQSVRVATKGTLDGFGHAVFELPALERPLAPGIYELRATLVFAAQGRAQQDQIKWCSGFWGAEDHGLINGLRESTPVVGNRPLHDKYWRDLLEVTRSVSSAATLAVGDTLGKNGADLRGAQASTGRKPPNLAIWTPLHDVIHNVEQLAAQKETNKREEAANLANPAFMNARLALLQQANPKAVMADAIKSVKAEAKAERDRIDALVVQAGGPSTGAEARALTSLLVATATVLSQLHAIQDRMRYVLWVLIEGVMRYTGFHSLDEPGRLTWHAIDRNDAASARNARLDRAAKLDQAALQARDETGSRQPPELWQAYTDYLRRRDETPDFDPVNFTRKQEGKLTLKVEAWAKHRQAWREALDKALQPWLEELDTGVRYANRTMPVVVAEIYAARDQLICLGYAYEYSLRTTLLKEDAAALQEEWKQAAGEDRQLMRLMDLSRTDRNQVKSRFDAHVQAAAKMADLEDFKFRWGAARAKGATLPGSKSQ